MSDLPLSYDQKKYKVEKRAYSLSSVKIHCILLYGFVGLVLLFLLVPIVVIPILSFGSSSWMEFPPPGLTLDWYKAFFSSSEWLIPIINSIKVALPVVVFSQIFGIPIAYAIVRGQFLGRHLLNSLFVTPMMMPYIIFAVAIYGLFLEVGLNGTFTGIIIAHTILVLPFVITNVANSLRTVNPAIEQAALSCGAGYLKTFFHITLPLIKKGVGAGAIFAFFLSWDEVIVAIFITSPESTTLPVKIWDSLRLDLSPVLAAVATILIAISTVILIIATSVGGASVIPSGIEKRNGKKGDIK